MSIVIWLLTFFLVLNCVVLILLVLIQLPKKEAGLGQAFGGSATDALFGAGSGNALTKMTKYSAAVFFVLTMLISILQGHQLRARNADPRLKLTRQDRLAAIAPAQTNVNAVPAAAVPETNASLHLTNPLGLAPNLPPKLTNGPQTNVIPPGTGTK
jgi:preprotein translocase subunit SecG